MAHLENDRGRSAHGVERRAIRSAPGAVVDTIRHAAAPVVVVAALLVWEVAARAGWISSLFFPPPSTIAATTVRLWNDGELRSNLGLTLGRVALGVLLGGVPGVLLGLLMGWFAPLRRALDPFVAALHPVPKIAVLPLIMVVFGIGEPSRVIVAASGAFFPLLINTMSGVRQIKPIFYQVAQNYGARRRHVLRRVVLPGSLPSVLTGLLLALNVTLLLTIAVEMVSGRTGLGAMIWTAWETMRVEELWATLAVITVLGIVFSAGLAWLTRLLCPWQVER